MSYQVDMVKDESSFVHLAQDQQHLIVNILFVLFQVAVHVLLQLCTDLTKTAKIMKILMLTIGKHKERNVEPHYFSVYAFIYLFAGDVLKVLARHDASEFGFNKALCPLSLWRPDKD